MFRFLVGVGTEAAVMRKERKEQKPLFCILKEPLRWDESWCWGMNAPVYLQHDFW